MIEMSTPDLGTMRRAAGLSEAELADQLGLSPDALAALERDPGEASLGLIQRWAQATGASGRPAALQLGRPYTGLEADARRLADYLEGWTGPVPTIGPESLAPAALAGQVTAVARPARALVSGVFDAGKTTLVSVLLGIPEGVLPTAFAPKTRLIVDFRPHASRPAWLSREVAYFRQGFDLDRLSAAEARQHHLREDDLASLHSYGTHDGGLSGLAGMARTAMRTAGMLAADGELAEAETAVVFNEAEPLCSFIPTDLPGHGSGNAGDDRKVDLAASRGDALIYMSPLAGFLGELDLMMMPLLAGRLPQVPGRPWENVAVVAGHAELDDAEVTRILDLGAYRLHRHLAGTGQLALGGRPVSEEELRARFFAFSARRPQRSLPLLKELERMLGTVLPPAREARVRAEVRASLDEARQQAARQVEALETSLRERTAAMQELEKMRGVDADRDRFVTAGRRQVAETIQREYAGAREDVDTIVNAWLEPARVEVALREEFAENDQEEARELALPLVMGKMQAEVDAAVKARAARVEEEVARFVKGYELGFSTGGTGTPGILPRFDARTAFEVGLAGTGVMLAVGKVLGLIVLGFPFAGLVAVVLALAGAYKLYTVLTMDWRARMARTVVDRLHKAQVLAEFQRGVRTMFKQAGESFDKGVSTMESGYKDYRQKLDDLLAGPDSDIRAERLLGDTRQLRDFYERAPWP